LRKKTLIIERIVRIARRADGKRLQDGRKRIVCGKINPEDGSRIFKRKWLENGMGMISQEKIRLDERGKLLLEY
jgi:hypothetical protein